jgi:hypothetical protein
MMRGARLLVLLAVLCLCWGRAMGAESEGVRFGVLDVFVDSSAAPLAAYQLEIRATNAGVKIVGIEGGEHAAFASPPFYDPKAMQQDRVIIAAFSVASAGKLPKGRTRVATIHFQAAKGDAPKFEVIVKAAASVDGKRIPVTATASERKPL